MQAFGIPRFDAGAQGIHLVWSWPDVLPLSEHGYDIQRLGASDQRMQERCETIDGPIIKALLAHGEYPAPLGPLRLRTAVKFVPINDPKLVTAGRDPGDHPPGFGDARQSTVDARISAALAASPVAQETMNAPLDEFIQELAEPTDHALVRARARVALAIALYHGKAVAIAPGTGGTPLQMELRARAIDTIIVYVRALQSMDICIFNRPVPGPKGDEWSNAPYVAKGLTLPIHATDPALNSAAKEYARAASRMVSTETVTHANFHRLAATLRPPAGASGLGRNGERILLVRADTAQSYEEMSFDAQLSMLALHPKLRRMLGFGFVDHAGLVAGHTYAYRVTGRFRAADLFDEIYDVHRIPASTVLPAAFSIRNLSLRFQTPVKVVLDPPPSTTALQTVSRRGIRIDTTGYDASWYPQTFNDWSAIVDFPSPVTKVVLEVAPGHAFAYAAGQPWAFSAAATPLPPGPSVELTFAAPTMELRLAGTGTLYAIRLPASGASGVVEVHAYTGPIRFAPQPAPVPPTVFSVYNLQQPPVQLTGSIDESTPVPPRPPAGFKLNWLPAALNGLATWPDDLDAGPPLDALAYQIEHRLAQPPATFGAWEPIQPEDNLTFGSRDMTSPAVQLEHGCDLDELFPHIRPRGAGAGFALHVSDVFGEKDPVTGAVRALQPFGSYHQYQIRSMDTVGRVSTAVTLSNVARLEKHIPPPLPVGPQPSHGTDPVPPPVDANGRLTTVPGPRARVIVKGAKGLTAADVAVLGTHQNAVVLEWGWRNQERDLDPTATEFRVYATAPPDALDGTINSVTSAPPYWKLDLTLASSTQVPLVANELAGLWIESNGYPFRVAQNDAGLTPAIRVEFAAIGTQQPVPGRVTFGRNLQPAHVRPASWRDRVAVYPVTANENYQHIFYDLLTLDEWHPRDVQWVGVAAADAQPYVPDERSAGALANRPGNESSIATCTAAARYRGQPVFSVPPPLGDVLEIVTDEPTGRSVLVSLDLNALLGGALAAGAPVSLERCSSDDVLSRAGVSGNDVVLNNPDGTQQTVTFANPGDQAAVLATLSSTDPQRLANKYLLHLVVASNDPAAFFTPVSGQTQQVGVVDDPLAPKPGRFLYFARAGDALGHVSLGGAILPVVVRIPSTALAATPRRRTLTATNSAVSLTVAVPADPETITALLFAHIDPPMTAPANQAGAELLRVPNRRDLYPLDGLRLRLADGSLLAPVEAKSLADLDVVVEANGTRVAILTANVAPGSWATLWCYAVTRDGFASYGCGPFGIGVGA